MKAPGLPSGFALKSPPLPFSFERKVGALPFGFALQDLHLPLVPGRYAREGTGPALLAEPAQLPEHDDAADHSLMKAGASQHMPHNA